MANNQIEIPCPETCPLKGMTHSHYEKVAGQPKKHKRKHRRSFDDDNPQFMVRNSEQKKLYKRKR